MRAVDQLSWAFFAIVALCSIGSGVAALQHADAWAAVLGIAGGVIGLLGVSAAIGASQVRDRQLAMTESRAALALDSFARLQNQMPVSYGG